MMKRRSFLARCTSAGFATTAIATSWNDRSRAQEPAGDEPRAVGQPGGGNTSDAGGVQVATVQPGEDLFKHIERIAGRFDAALYKRILGAANEFKEGDAIVGVAAADDASRDRARQLLANTLLRDLDAHPLLADQLGRLIDETTDRPATPQRENDSARSAGWRMSDLKRALLDEPESAIHEFKSSLSSLAIGCVVKLMSNDELIAVGRKVFNPLPGSRIGARGYLGARIQPNSPTDHVDDIRWQVFDGFAYAVGDVVLGTNPVSSEPESVAAVERTLKDVLETFGIGDVMPHCVLAHIDVQAEVERREPGSTALWFQSIAGSDSANATFDISVDKMMRYAVERTGPFGLYFETGQGADFTNGHAHGFDMVLHESRKYGFARAMQRRVAEVRGEPAWVHLNDVAGFIGPEVFRSREQLVRCCLEDIVMGKLHGLTIGLDVCSTLHMDVPLDDLDWCLDQIAPANPAYLMALPTKIDPMLGYLTTGYHDHVRLRERFGYRVNDAMRRFFEQIQIVDEAGRPTEHFGDPAWVYLQYCRRRGDERSEAEIRREAREQIAAVRGRGVFLAEGHGRETWDLPADLRTDIDRIYADAKRSIWAELTPEFVSQVPSALPLATKSRDRTDYILHPESGERLGEPSAAALRELRRRHAGKYDVQIVVSDGLNALSIMEEGHLVPYLARLRENLERAGRRPAPENIVVTSGRVRAGYRIGELLFSRLEGPRALLHVIGERPGTGHRTFSIYITSPDGSVWGGAQRVDHNLTKVVSGVALTALEPSAAADATARLLATLQ